MIHDAIIVGAGPAGGTAAYNLAKAGMKPLVLDKYVFPRYKACGGFISNKILKALDFDVTDMIEKNVYSCGLTYKSANGFKILMEESIGALISRDRFDNFLMEKAKIVGASFLQGERVIDFKKEEDLYKVFTDKGQYRCRYLIGADGANSIIRKKSRLAHKIKRFFTLTAEFALSGKVRDRTEDTAWFDLGDVPYGYGWVFPKAKHLTVGFGLFYGEDKRRKKDPKIYMHELHQKNKMISDLKMGRMRGCFISTLTDERSNICGKGLFLAGEAAGLVDPFSGEGIYYAVASSKILSELIINNFDNESYISENYKNKIKEEILKEFKVASRLAKIIYTFPKLSFQILNEYKHLANYYYHLLSGNVSYQDLYDRLIDKVKKKIKNGLKSVITMGRG